MDALSNIFWNEGLLYANHSPVNSDIAGYRKFRCLYGVSPKVCSLLWNEIKSKPSFSQPKHLLWCLLFLKTYGTEHVNASIVGVDEKTFRFWVWKFVKLVSALKVVKWDNRLKHSGVRSNLNVTLDGVDFRICEPSPFNKKWYSHKFKAAGIRYEIGVSVRGGAIVWASGGFPCGEWPDIKIAKDLFVHNMNKNEIALADKGYIDRKYFRQPTNSIEKRLLARHETLNGRLKNFQILSNRFRHSLQKHPFVFHACVNIVQMSIYNGEILFEI